MVLGHHVSQKSIQCIFTFIPQSYLFIVVTWVCFKLLDDIMIVSLSLVLYKKKTVSEIKWVPVFDGKNRIHKYTSIMSL